MHKRIPLLDLPGMHAPLESAFVQVFKEALDKAAFIGGETVASFEKAFAEYCHTEGCVGVANGTDALFLALRVAGIGPGDKVAVPALTFIATAEAVNMCGATPVFVDVDPVTYTMDPVALSALKEDIKAIIPVHLYGQPADMGPLLLLAQQHGWVVLEDCAQAHGAAYHGRVVGSMGHFGAFSFYPGKNLGAFGDAGAVVSKDIAFLADVRRLADHGRLSRYEHAEPGVNSRIDAIQAGVLSVKLQHLTRWNNERAKVAGWYNEAFAGVDGVVLPRVAPMRTHVYHLYSLLVEDRDSLRGALASEGIDAAVHYALPLHLQPAYQYLGYAQGDFPVAEHVAARCLSVPMYPGLPQSDVERVASVVSAHIRAGA